jgi:hypothetical protein
MKEKAKALGTNGKAMRWFMDDYKSTGSKFGKDILRDVRRIQEEMDLLFDHFYKLRHSPVLTARRIWRPPTDSGNETAGFKRNPLP